MYEETHYSDTGDELKKAQSGSWKDGEQGVGVSKTRKNNKGV